MMEGRGPRLEAEVEGGVRAVTGWSEGETRGRRPVRKSCKGRGCWRRSSRGPEMTVGAL